MNGFRPTLSLIAVLVLVVITLLSGELFSPGNCLGQTAAGVELPTSQPARAAAEVETLIAEAGRVDPDWLGAVPLEYPPTLDLLWAKPVTGWEPQKYLGPYIWSIIDPVPGRWRGGVKLMHHVLTLNAKDPAKVRQTQDVLARLYFDLGDFAHSAWWLRRCNTQPGRLARCYWKLGCKPMAVQLMNSLSNDPTPNGEMVRLWAEMGEPAIALAWAERRAQSDPSLGYVLAGDVWRREGDFDKALACYTKALSVKSTNRSTLKNKKMAEVGAQTVKGFASVDLGSLRDGVYTGAGTGYRGDVTVAITVKAGRIESAKIVAQKEDGYFYAICEAPVVHAIERCQGPVGVDAITGATVTSAAILEGTSRALAAPATAASPSR